MFCRIVLKTFDFSFHFTLLKNLASEFVHEIFLSKNPKKKKKKKPFNRETNPIFPQVQLLDGSHRTYEFPSKYTVDRIKVWYFF
jgi:hypothetical protein